MNRNDLLAAIKKKLKLIYAEEYKEEFEEQLDRFIARWETEIFEKTEDLSEKNIFLITYGDSIYEEGVKTLATLQSFLKQQVGDLITDVHILPMFPYTSDDGFSVVDYMKINEKMGDWENITAFSQDYRLMFDFVANHISKASQWFQGYLNGDAQYEQYFIAQNENFDTSKVIRPRTSPLFHTYRGEKGEKTAWTTFSEDQIDINFRHFPVFLHMSDILLQYAKNGASAIRLDAVGFLWKESGTGCMSLPQTHAIIEIWRLLLDYFKKNTKIITETNVPHTENISYFGNGTNEAHMVYQFTLPPLVLYALLTHDATKLTEWAKTIKKVSDSATYFNFLSSHDGIGLRPTEGILNDEERAVLIRQVIKNGGKVSYKNNADGSQSVYELNINYNDALMGDDDQSFDQQIDKIMASNAILLSCIGVPALYYHSLLGSRNDYKGLEQYHINRRINREKLERKYIEQELQTDERRKKIFSGIKALLQIRKNQSAFSPYAEQKVLDFGKEVFALERYNKKTKEKIVLLLNVTNHEIAFHTDLEGVDCITNKKVTGKVRLHPYEFLWVKPQ